MEAIQKEGFHNPRNAKHSKIVNHGLLRDLRVKCAPLRRDLERTIVHAWFDTPAPGGRSRNLDFLIAEPIPGTKRPDLAKTRICIENKSVITAHRNRTNRYDDLNEVMSVLHRTRPEAVLAATVMVGVADRFLNVSDRIIPYSKNILSALSRRLSKGDSFLWSDFPAAISSNRPNDSRLTMEKFRQLPMRGAGQTHLPAFDVVFVVPVFIDNVDPPHVARKNSLGIDVDKEYQSMLNRICQAYKARWHM